MNPVLNRVKVKLHGQLAAVVGRDNWVFCIERPLEVFAALEANTQKLFPYLFENPDSEYRLLVDGRDIYEFGELGALRPMKEIDVIPVIAGSGKVGGWLALIGLVIIAAVLVIASGGTTAPGVLPVLKTAMVGWSGFALTLGITLTLAGISQMVMKAPNAKDYERPENKPSYLFNGPVNSYRQGNVISVGFGAGLVGSQVISAGIRSVDLLPSVA
jgi:predicted phage tail protein